MVYIDDLLDMNLLIDDTTPLLRKRNKSRYIFPMYGNKYQIEFSPYSSYIKIKYLNDMVQGRGYLIGTFSSYEAAQRALLENIIYRIASNNFGMKKNEALKLKEKIKDLTKEKFKKLLVIGNLYKTKEDKGIDTLKKLNLL